MNYISRLRDKRIVGLSANVLSLLILFRFIVTFAENVVEFSTSSNVGAIITIGILILGVSFLLISSRFLKENQRQSKINITGKIIAWLFSWLVIIFPVTDNVEISNYKSILLLLLAIANIVYIPYSFYLLSKKTEPIENITSEGTAVDPDKLKLPPTAWR
jgi:hypothetical protein